MSSPNYDSGFDSPQSNLFQCDFQQQSDQQVLNQNYQLFDGEFVNQGLGATDVPSYHAFQATFPANHVSEANFRANHAAGNGAMKTDGGRKRKKLDKVVPTCFVPKSGNAKPRTTKNKKQKLNKVTKLKNKSIKISSSKKVCDILAEIRKKYEKNELNDLANNTNFVVKQPSRSFEAPPQQQPNHQIRVPTPAIATIDVENICDVTVINRNQQELNGCENEKTLQVINFAPKISREVTKFAPKMSREATKFAPKMSREKMCETLFMTKDDLKSNQSPLFVAIGKGDVLLTKLLVENFPEVISVTDSIGNTPLHYTGLCLTQGHQSWKQDLLSILEILLRNSRDVYCKNDKGQTFLEYLPHDPSVMQILEKFQIHLPGSNDQPQPTNLDDDWLLMKELADLLE